MNRIRSTVVWGREKTPVIMTPGRVMVVFAWGFAIGMTAGMVLAAIITS